MELVRKEMTPLEELRHSCAHVLASAVMRLFPEAKLDIGPPTKEGFYYDFDLTHRLTAEDLEKIEAEMRAIIKENQPFLRKEVSRSEAIGFFNQKNQPYKLSRLEDIPEGAPISFYSNGEFTDLCAGTHVRYTKSIKAFKLLNIAGAYYRGSEKNKQLQRIYGTAFPSKQELDEYLQTKEAAKERDHRKLGKELRLFVIDETVGAGMVLWTPRGAIIRKALQAFISEALREEGYEEVFTPHIGKLTLFRTSGHFPYYKDSQFPPIIERDQIKSLAQEEVPISALDQYLESGQLEGYLLKPMNCPMHAKIFASEPRSYKDLPVRLAEFGTVYRWEQSGELSGMTRVRGFTQDDAHIFCTEDQLKGEIEGCLRLVNLILTTLGMKNFRVRLGLRDPDASKYVGDSALWDAAEGALRSIVRSMGFEYKEEAGEAAFYGPKIDFIVSDCLGRDWQLGTVQVDYNLPKRFELRYTGPDNRDHTPIMVHRAPFGSLERFTGVLIEHFGGNFPTWLAPEQVRLVTVSENFEPYAKEIESLLKAHKVRVVLDRHADKLGAKIRRAELEKVPYTVIIGEKESLEKTVSVRSRVSKELTGDVSLQAFVEGVLEDIEQRKLPNV